MFSLPKNKNDFIKIKSFSLCGSICHLPVLCNLHCLVGAILLMLVITTLAACATGMDSSNQAIQQVGKGAYRIEPLSKDSKVPEAPFRTVAMLNQAVPTNQWYSSVVFTKWSEVIHALPLTFKATEKGLEMSLPQKQIIATERQDVEVFYPHVADLVFSPVGFQPQAANLAAIGDWHAVVSMDGASQSMAATLAHGSPYVWLQLSSGDLRLNLASSLQAAVDAGNSSVLLVEGQGKYYAVFAPTGGEWQQQSGSGSAIPTTPTYGDSSTLAIYDGDLDAALSWKAYNPENAITTSDGDYLNIVKTGINGNIYAVFGDPQTGERADLSYWQDQGELVLDVRLNSSEEGVDLLVKVDSGWPNVSDYAVPLPAPGEWATIRIPMHQLIANGNRFNPGAHVSINSVENLVVFEPTGVMNVDIDNVRLEINPDIAVAATNSWILRLPEGKRYVSAAVLPDNSQTTIDLYTQSAYAHLTSTKIDWHYDREASLITTKFTPGFYIVEGDQVPSILGLYPHHYFGNSNLPPRQVGELQSIRGPIRFFQTDGFSLQQTYNGFVPWWPVTSNEDQRDDLQTQLGRDVSRSRAMIIEIGWGTYWQGKGLQRISQLMNIAHVMGEESKKERLLDLLKERIDEWFSTNDPNWYFHYATRLGTMVGYPDEYGTVKQLNDHHFHYGYWIRAAAEIALQDPDWAKEENYGGMINLLVGDIATNERGKKQFPFLRNFDPYESHSWASGTALSPDGNNQESSSEAVNAWAGLILWGTVTGNQDLVDLGVYLYTSEINAIRHYWFDLEGITLPPEYTELRKDVSIVFGGRLAHNTWWTDEPRQIHGINLIPLTTASTYLASHPGYISTKLAMLEKEMKIYADRGKVAKPADIWQDIFAKYLALANPTAGRERWDPYGSFELGDTRSHALHWLTTLDEIGVPDLSVTANTPLYAVFKKGDGSRTYLVFNAANEAMDVRFSNGTSVSAQPGQLTVKTGAGG